MTECNHNGETVTPHARAVRFACDRLTDAGHTVISANTDERGEPQIFAQSDSGELAFYFVRTGEGEPTSEQIARFRALAAKHAVTAYTASVALGTEPRCSEFRRL